MHTELPSCRCSRGSSPPSCSCSSASWLWWYVRTPTLGRFALCDGRISQPCSGMRLSCPTSETGRLYSLCSPFVLGLEMCYSISNLTLCLVKCQTKNRNPFEFLFQKKLMKKFLLPFIDKSFSFSPKKPFQILCERRVSRHELASSNLHFPNWR